MRVVQGMKDQVYKCGSTVKSLINYASYSSSSKHSRHFSSAVDSAKNKMKFKQAEESLSGPLYHLYL
uniref:Uncharacterized protein n=1 Tax=Manihot esculenta TaxID=3983 RepID=A0A2C9U4K5_MANES